MTASLPTIQGYQPIPLPAGIYAPIPTAFIEDTEDLDLETTVRHAIRIAKAGVGIVTCGSTGEATSMSSNERAQVCLAIRTAFQQQGLQTPIVAGTGGGSLRETVSMCKDAKKSGADAVIVISPSYFGANLQADRQGLINFFHSVADQSPLPVMVYNFPAVTNGIDMDSELLEQISQHPNICGAKLTCAGVGKLGRLANSTSVKQVKRSTPFHAAPGFGDIIFPCMMIGATLAIVGTANVVPRLCAQHFNDIVQFQQSPSKELLNQIQTDQDIISRFDRATSKTGIVGTKWMLERFYYKQGAPRLPLRKLNIDFASMQEAVTPALQRERQLEQEQGITQDPIQMK
ncbi:hypothetical protein L7F22_039237 [Adiantum nelumboides]|nr:hypothetical protein [Adiantum nelumboides]